MTWREYVAVALPPNVAAVDAEKGTVIRLTIRWIAMRVSFVLFHLRLSANQVSLFGWLLGITGLGLVGYARHLPHWSAGLVVLCCSGSTFMDFCDGPVARARHSANRLGRIFDGISTDFMRSGLLVAFGIVANSPVFVVLGLVSGYIVVSIRNQFIWSGLLAPGPQDEMAVVLSKLRVAFSVPTMTGVLPLFFAVAVFLDSAQVFARSVLSLYLTLSLGWFWLACWAARAATPEMSAMGQRDAGADAA